MRYRCTVLMDWVVIDKYEIITYLAVEDGAIEHRLEELVTYQVAGLRQRKAFVRCCISFVQ